LLPQPGAQNRPAAGRANILALILITAVMYYREGFSTAWPSFASARHRPGGIAAFFADWIVRDASLVLAIAAELRLVPSATPDWRVHGRKRLMI
jgi:hypothetical protein